MENYHQNSRKVLMDAKNDGVKMALPTRQAVQKRTAVGDPAFNCTTTVARQRHPGTTGSAPGDPARAQGALIRGRILYLLIAAVAVVPIGPASVPHAAGRSRRHQVINRWRRSSRCSSPGLHYRIPLVNDVQRFDRRIITQLYPSERWALEQEQLVDFYVKWRIENLRKFYESTSGTEDMKTRALGEVIKDSIERGDAARCSRSSRRTSRLRMP